MLSLSKHGTAGRTFPCLDVFLCLTTRRGWDTGTVMLSLSTHGTAARTFPCLDVPYASPLAEDGALATSC
ncbi:MAG: hypothetical protein AMXMBFR61_12840 [Fimbriimonadales bacterium]